MSNHIEWWNSLSDEESIQILKEEGIYGHDQGVTDDEIKQFYQERFKEPLQKILDDTNEELEAKLKVGDKVVLFKKVWGNNGKGLTLIDIPAEVTSVKGLTENHINIHDYKFSYEGGGFYANHGSKSFEVISEEEYKKFKDLFEENAKPKIQSTLSLIDFHTTIIKVVKEIKGHTDKYYYSYDGVKEKFPYDNTESSSFEQGIYWALKNLDKLGLPKLIMPVSSLKKKTD